MLGLAATAWARPLGATAKKNGSVLDAKRPGRHYRRWGPYMSGGGVLTGASASRNRKDAAVGGERG